MRTLHLPVLGGRRFNGGRAGFQERDNGIYTYRVKDVSQYYNQHMVRSNKRKNLNFSVLTTGKKRRQAFFIGEETYVPGAYQYFLDYNILSRRISRPFAAKQGNPDKRRDDWWDGKANGFVRK